MHRDQREVPASSRQRMASVTNTMWFTTLEAPASTCPGLSLVYRMPIHGEDDHQVAGDLSRRWLGAADASCSDCVPLVQRSRGLTEHLD